MLSESVEFGILFHFAGHLAQFSAVGAPGDEGFMGDGGDSA
jgi:hypothetical protein